MCVRLQSIDWKSNQKLFPRGKKKTNKNNKLPAKVYNRLGWPTDVYYVVPSLSLSLSVLILFFFLSGEEDVDDDGTWRDHRILPPSSSTSNAKKLGVFPPLILFSFPLLPAYIYVHISPPPLYVCIYYTIDVCTSIWVNITSIRSGQASLGGGGIWFWDTRTK